MNRPRKRFGQNFLVDGGIIDRIFRAIDPSETDRIVEIGPGHGALTTPLLASGCALKVIEIDRDLAAELSLQHPGMDLVNEDVLKTDINRWYPGQSFRVVGNLPYNISTPLLFRLLDHTSQITDMFFMLQLEVVNRLAAEPSTKAYGRLSVMAQVQCNIEKLFEVPPEAFSPRPKVQSAIVRLTPHAGKPDIDYQKLERLLAAAFSARRKTIRNALREFLSEADLDELELTPTLRPENLTVSDYVRCVEQLGK